MHKKVSILKFLKILLVFLTLSSFVVSCNGSMQPEPEPGPNTEIDDEGENESGNESGEESGKESGNENGNESDNESGNEDEGESEEQSGNDAGTVTESIAVPEGLTITDGDKTNFVKVTWTANDSPYYWIFYSTTENTEDSILVTKKADQTTAEEGYQFALPPEASGTCYFWIKAADGYEETSKTSAFSEAVSCSFIYKRISNPVNFKVAEGSTPEEVKLTWSDNGAAYYWIFYSQVKNSEEAECITRSATASDANGYLFKLRKPGTYYFWIKAADGKKETSPSSNFSSCKSYRLSTTDLIAPDKIFIEPDSSKANVVKVKIIETGAPYYWLYQNTTDDSSTAKCITTYFRYSSSEYSVPLYSSGTYYFWVKAAASSSESSSTSGFSKVASYEFTHQDLTPPTGLTVTASEKTNTVKVTWTPNEANYCWIYYNTKNDPTTATCASNFYHSSSGNSGCEIKLSKTGTHYFWLKSADSSSLDSYTSDFSEVVTYDFTNSIPAPTGLSVQAGSETNTVLLTWTPNDSEYYWIYYNDKNETETATCATTGATSSTATGYKILLKNSGTYYFWIAGSSSNYSSAELSSYSEPVTYEFNNPLNVPTGLSAGAGKYLNTVKLTWIPNNSSYYWIYVNTENNPKTATCKTRSVSSSYATDGYSIPLSTSGTYYFWVKGADGSYESSASSDFSPAVSYNFVYNTLTPPTGLSVKLGSSINKAKVTWNDNNFADYWIYYNTENNPETATCATKSASSYYATSGYIITLPSAGLYYFWIKSADGSLDSSASSGFSEAVSFEFPETMPAPTELRITEGSTFNSVKVYWTATGSDYYWIYYNTENNPETAICSTKFATSSDSTNGWLISGLQQSGTYYFWVKGANSSSESAETTDFSSVATYNLILKAPTGLSVINTSSNSNLIKITWNDTGAFYYWVYYNTENDTTTATCITKKAYLSTSGCQIDLPQSGTYYIWVKSATGFDDNSSTSDFSESLVYTFTNSLPTPTSIAVTDAGSLNTIKLTWVGGSNTSYYYCLYYNTENKIETATCLTQNILSSYATDGFSITLNKSGTFYFWIRTATTNYNSPKSDYSSVYKYDFTLTPLTPPTGLRVVAGSGTNEVKVYWNDNNAITYWIYYNTVNDTETATCATKLAMLGTLGETITLPSSGTYYFWIKAANGSNTTVTSDFSEYYKY